MACATVGVLEQVFEKAEAQLGGPGLSPSCKGRRQRHNSDKVTPDQTRVLSRFYLGGGNTFAGIALTDAASSKASTSITLPVSPRKHKAAEAAALCVEAHCAH